MKLTNILEKTIGKVSQKINVVVQLDMTKHAEERKDRHDKYITDTEIKFLADRAVKQISKLLIMDELDINDKIGIHDIKSDLNLVGQIKRQGDMLDLVIITVMVEKNFRFSKVDKVIHI